MHGLVLEAENLHTATQIHLSIPVCHFYIYLFFHHLTPETYQSCSFFRHNCILLLLLLLLFKMFLLVRVLFCIFLVNKNIFNFFGRLSVRVSIMVS